MNVRAAVRRLRVTAGPLLQLERFPLMMMTTMMRENSHNLMLLSLSVADTAALFCVQPFVCSTGKVFKYSGGNLRFYCNLTSLQL